jgi:hypothetical protein
MAKERERAATADAIQHRNPFAYKSHYYEKALRDEE